ncbi:tryptophan-rich sensory protein [Halorubrum sp. SD626R]|uniref:TspO/MBR family protein n=1 Tax=Halorubrum TaxID=56688 RepID=UPI0010F556D6|nr:MULTISPECIES: TspO/MBR family protein [Halorubrum]TKX79194.1 tryptophan-rich sensory protein [Halorubrum sp. SD626R]
MVSLVARFRQFPRNRPVISLVIAILTVEIVGAAGSVFTAQSLTTWYGTLQRPMIAPPNWVFGPVWATLFALMGVALWLVWRQIETSPREAWIALGVFLVHFVFNLGWSAVFFGLQELGWGLAVIGLLWLLIVTAMWAFDRVDRRAALLLVPYLLWVSFAVYLNYRFWVLN